MSLSCEYQALVEAVFMHKYIYVSGEILKFEVLRMMTEGYRAIPHNSAVPKLTSLEFL